MGILNDLFKKKWASKENIELAAEIDARNSAANVLSSLDIDNGLGNIRLKDIFNNVLVNKFGYDYTIIYIDSWLKYWTGRYSIIKRGLRKDDDIPKEHLIPIKNAIYYGFKWNSSGIGILNDEIFSGTIKDPVYNLNGEIISGELIPWSWCEVNYNNQKTEIKYKYDSKGSQDNIYLTLERDGIGHFIKLLKFIQVDIYLNRLVAINATRFIEKWGVEIRDVQALTEEIELFLSPDSNFFAKVVDLQNGKMSNNFIPPSVGSDHKFMSLLTYIKAYKEEYYSLFGRKIENSKQDPLTSDANLNIATAEQIARNYDEKICLFINDFNNKYGTDYELLIDDIYDNEKNDNHDASTKIKLVDSTNKTSDAGGLLEDV